MTKIKTISYDDYLRLAGLLALADDHRRMLQAIERSACAISGDDPERGGHTSDAIWSQGYSAQRLLELMGIAVPIPPPTITTPEDAARQAAGAMRIVKRFPGELFPE